MLRYSNIINDPYPDTRDPVTGEWLPKSYNQVKSDYERELSESAQKHELSLLMSLLK